MASSINALALNLCTLLLPNLLLSVQRLFPLTKYLSHSRDPDLFSREQELSNLLHEKRYLKALGLAISLDRPHTVLMVVKGESTLCSEGIFLPPLLSRASLPGRRRLQSLIA